MDDKITDKHSYTITDKVWLKIATEAAMMPPGLRPRLRITMPGIPKLCVMLEDDYLYMMGQSIVE